MLGRRWQHSDRRDRALDRARRLYEHLITLDNDAAMRVYRDLIRVTDAWNFTLNPTGEYLVAWRARPVEKEKVL